MIPSLDDRGLLPPGIHSADWEELQTRFGASRHRRVLLEGLRSLMEHLEEVGCRRIYVDGSFVSAKPRPNDYDACWAVDGVKIELLDPVLATFTPAGKAAMAAKYGGDIRPDAFSPVELDMTYLQFFQVDRNGEPKGIVCLELAEATR